MSSPPNKAQRWVHEALAEVASELPFPLRGLDSDNGSEFINNTLFAWCTDRRVTFTRTRPWRKNDSCFVEQKNWAVVRRAAGYLRYDTKEELEVLRRLYGVLGLYVNFFQPQMKSGGEDQGGSQGPPPVRLPRTPYRRMLASPHVSPGTKAALTRTYEELNPVALKREIVRCQERLVRLAKRRKPEGLHSSAPDHPWREYQPQGFSSRGHLP